MSGRIAMALVGLLLLALGSPPRVASAEDLPQRTQRLEKQMVELQKELAEIKQKQEAEVRDTARKMEEGLSRTQAAIDGVSERTLTLLERVKVGGYGSVRFEGNTLNQMHDTFTLRRLVLTTAAKIAPRLSFYSELEFERFRKLELDRKPLTVSAGGLKAQQAIEGTDNSEISLEQAWLQYDLIEGLSLRAGAVLVPVGRFNIRHDDNLWNLPRRSLVDRGVPVLPSTAAWDELGAGVVGKVPVGARGYLDYQFYVLNGVSLTGEIENVAQTRAGDTSKLAAEVELFPQTGTFANDSKSAKALSGRVAFSPAPGHEFAPSFYWGRYTPGFLPDQSLWSIGFDGLTTWGPIQLEGEYVFTRFEGLKDVAGGFARAVGNKESEAETGDVETEVEFELSQLARTKHGYWLEARYSFWPQFLSNTFLGRMFNDPQLVPLIRVEQVWMPSLLKKAEFSDGVLTSFETQSRLINRITPAIAYRPTPLVGFTLAYEYTRTNAGKSLSDVTNFLTAGPHQNDVHTLLVGATFGF